MKIDAPLLAAELADVAGEARELEALGYDGAFTFEGAHDPFFPLLLAAEHTRTLELATAVTIAFPRSPMQLANVAHDLQAFSRGRFVLGLGSQIKPHIEKRFGTAWVKPVARMRELILALRAIWRAFNEGEQLDFRGEFYRHTLMTPFFNPGPTGHGPPRVFLGAVGPAMTRVAGEVADGVFVHPLNSPEFLRAVTLPALAEGFARGGRDRHSRSPGGDGDGNGDGSAGARFQIACQALVITGFDDDAVLQAEAMTKMQLAFYGSTPQYRCVLEAHGWGELQPELNALSKQGRWLEMSALIDDAMLGAFTVRCEPQDVASRLRSRYAGLADRVAIVCHSQPQRADRERWAGVLADCKREH